MHGHDVAAPPGGLPTLILTSLRGIGPRNQTSLNNPTKGLFGIAADRPNPSQEMITLDVGWGSTVASGALRRLQGELRE